MVALAEGHGGHSVHIYTDILLREPCISGKPILLVEYLLYIAVKEGEVVFHFIFVNYLLS